MTEVARWLGATPRAMEPLTWGFGRGLDEIYAVVRPGNEPSMNVCRRLGMAALGRTTAYYDTESELFRITRSEQG